MSAATKAATKPMAMIGRSAVVKTLRFLNRSKAKAPTMVGMARKKENSAAARLSTPKSSAPTMVEPERDVPGISDRHWNSPICR